MFRRFATATILDARMGDDKGFAKDAHRAVFNYTPRPGFLYVRSRAISSRCNDNYDMFPAAEIEKSWQTFIGKPVFVNHHNEDHRRARGMVIDAALHRDTLPNGGPDTWVEALMEIDALTYPKLAKAILAKEVNRTSMGCDVQFSKCSVCEKVATSPLEYCQHIPGKKGKRILKMKPDGTKEAILVYEICSGLSFFENSLLVEQPADPTAFFLGEVEYGPGLESMVASVQKTATWGARERLDDLYHLGREHAWQGKEPQSDNETYLLGHEHGTVSRDQHRSKTSTVKTAGKRTESAPCVHCGAIYSDGEWHGDDHGHDHETADDRKWRRSSPHYRARPEDDDLVREAHRIWDLIKLAERELQTNKTVAEEGQANDHVRSFQGREVPDHGDRVAVYRDLSGAPKSGYPARGSWSIKRMSERGGKSPHVHAHTVGMHITEAEPTFDEGARKHFKEQEKRGVHAYISGKVHHYAHPLEPGEKPEGSGWRQVSYYPDISHFFMKDTRNKYHGSDEAAFRGGSMWARGNVKEGDDGPVPLSRFEQPKTGSIWGLIHEAELIGDDLDNDLREEDPMYWNRVGSIQPPTSNWQFRAKTAKLNDDHPYETVVPEVPLKQMTDEQKSTHQARLKEHASSWMKRNPVDPQNVVDHWDHATADEKENGLNWYADAHHATKAVAEHTGTPMHAMAGLVSNYSPQTHWATNIITAAKSARLKMGLGGKGNKHGEPALEGKKKGLPRGIMASEGQRRTGEALVNAPHDENEALASGQHYEHLLKGPKTKAFARLIHNGGDDHSVVVDRHAFSVASGARASDAAYGFSGLGGKKRYGELENTYREAARRISEKEGRTIHPHQVQAATWLVRQRLNEQGDRELVNKGARSASAAHRAIKEMHHYMGEHHPGMSTQMPGTGYSQETGLAREDLSPKKQAALTSVAFGETKAPQDVDTLRAENCTVCGNSTAFDGVQCQICGYVAPPRPFGDPDTDQAKQNDIRKQVLDSADGTADPNDPDQQLGNQIGDPDILDEQADEAAEEGVVPALTCDNCGTSITPPPPATTGGEPPFPAEGDACPVCNKGMLAADSNGEAEEEVEDDEDGDGVPDDEEESESKPSDESDEDDESDEKNDKDKKKP